MIESSGNPKAIGDIHRQHAAYGIVQITSPCLQDVNRIYKQDVKKTFGRTLVHKDMLDPEKALWVCEKYLTFYGKQYTKATGKEPTARIYCAIWNAGPQGYKRLALTDKYWKRFSEIYKQIEKQQAKETS